MTTYLDELAACEPYLRLIIRKLKPVIIEISKFLCSFYNTLTSFEYMRKHISKKK